MSWPRATTCSRDDRRPEAPLSRLRWERKGAYRRPPARQAALGARCPRQHETELAALAGLRGDLQAAARQMGDAERRRQAQAEPAGRRARGPPEGELGG